MRERGIFEIKKIKRFNAIKHSDIIAYAFASGDHNPIHTDPSFAKKLGHPDAIAHGMYIMGLVSRAIEEWFPDKRFKSFQVRFVSPVLPGEQLTIKGEFESNGEENPLSGEIVVVDKENQLKLKGNITL